MIQRNGNSIIARKVTQKPYTARADGGGAFRERSGVRTRGDKERWSLAGAYARPGGRALARMALVAIIVLALSAPLVGADVGPVFTRHVERLVATPTPLGPALLLSDAAAWRVDVPSEGVVVVEAHGSTSAPFYLRANRSLSNVALPLSHQSILLHEPGAWRVEVDPAAGVVVDITVTFRGHVGRDGTGKPLAFTLTDLESGDGCVVVGVCLP